MPGMGKITTKRLMEEIGISETRKLRGLTPRQTKELTDRFS
jgi:ribosomal protein S13